MEKKVLILSDGKPGHVNQSLGVARYIQDAHVTVKKLMIKDRYRDIGARVRSLGLPLWPLSPARARAWLHWLLTADCVQELLAWEAHLILSTGSSAGAPNLMLARYMGVPSVTCMIPSPMGTGPFDLALVPRHFQTRMRDNIFLTLGVPNPWQPGDAREEVKEWGARLQQDLHSYPKPCLGLLLGGNDPYHEVQWARLQTILQGITTYLSGRGSLLLTTSRRTPNSIREALRAWIKEAPFPSLYIQDDQWDANPLPMMAVLSSILMVTEDSLSMMSEAVSCHRKVLILGLERKKKGIPRTQRLRKDLQDHGYIRYLAREEGQGLAALLRTMEVSPPGPEPLQEAKRCAREMEKRFWSPREVEHAHSTHPSLP